MCIWVQHFGYQSSLGAAGSRSDAASSLSTIPRVLSQVFRVIRKPPLVSASHQPLARVCRGRCTQTLSPIAAETRPFVLRYRDARRPGEAAPLAWKQALNWGNWAAGFH